MKKITIVLLASAVISGCAASAKKVEHTDFGGTTTADKRYSEDLQFCTASYLEAQATTEEDKAKVKAMYEGRTFEFKLLVTRFALSHASESGDAAALHGDECMTEKGWVAW